MAKEGIPGSMNILLGGDVIVLCLVCMQNHYLSSLKLEILRAESLG